MRSLFGSFISIGACFVIVGVTGGGDAVTVGVTAGCCVTVGVTPVPVLPPVLPDPPPFLGSPFLGSPFLGSPCSNRFLIFILKINSICLFI